MRVRSYECDQYGHVNNANYLNYLEFGRWEYLREAKFPYDEALADGYGIYVARIEIDYRRPAFPDDELVIETWPIKKGAVSGTLQQRILRGEEVLADAKVSWAFVDAKGRPCRIPKRYNIPELAPR